MKKTLVPVGFLVMAILLAVWPNTLRAQGGYEPVTGDAFTKAVPNDFYLEGNRIPVDKNNAVLLKNAKGARVVLAIIDTAGYSSQVQQKYIGMLISETRLSVCTIAIGVGSYGFGLDRPKAPSTADAKFSVYNQAGMKLGSCAVKNDDTIKQPKPLAVATEGGATKLDLGKYAVEIK